MYKVKAIIILGVLACVLNVNAQEIKEKTLSFDGAQTVYLKLAFGDNITVKGWDKNEVYVKTSVEINGGKLNKAFKMSYDKEGSELVVKSEIDHDLMKTGKKEDCGGKYSKYSATYNGVHYYACYKITYQCEYRVKKEAEIVLFKITIFELLNIQNNDYEGIRINPTLLLSLRLL